MTFSLRKPIFNLLTMFPVDEVYQTREKRFRQEAGMVSVMQRIEVPQNKMEMVIFDSAT